MASQTLRPIRLALTIASVAAALILPASAQVSRPAASVDHQSVRQPVLVELFTSEGCSDCPPADALLAQLDSTQPVPGAEAIVLSEHVTYWNHEGWRDPFSLDAMTGRQQVYQHEFALSEAYTPQIVVDGAEQMVGSDSAKVEGAVARAAMIPKLDIEIGDAHRAADGSVGFSVHGTADSKATLVAVLAENATHSEVSHGENAGRTLQHVAVVRVLKEFGFDAIDGRTLRLSGSNLRDAEEAGTPLRLVVFLVSHKNGHVVAVAEQTLSQ
jgi:hypothetical protein